MSWPMTNLDFSRLAAPKSNSSDPLPPPRTGVIPPWLEISLQVGVIQELGKRWVVPSGLKPMSQGEVDFLKNHTVQDLLKNQVTIIKSDTSFWKQFVVSIVSGFASAYVANAVANALPKDQVPLSADVKKEGDATAVKLPMQGKDQGNYVRQPAAQGHGAISDLEFSKPPPLPSEAVVVGKELQSRLIKISFKEGLTEIETRINNTYLNEAQNLPNHLREAHIAEGKQVSSFVTGTLKGVAGVYTVGSAIAEDPSREGLLNFIFEKTKDAIVDKSKEVIVDQLVKIAPGVLGKAILTEITGGLDTFLSSPELNPNEANQLRAEEWKHLPPPWEAKRPITDYLPYTTPSKDGYFEAYKGAGVQ